MCECEKADPSIELTEAGIPTDFNVGQPVNVPASIRVNRDGDSNASVAIELPDSQSLESVSIEHGTVSVFRAGQLANAQLPMKESRDGDENAKLSRIVHPEKHEVPID
jgi:hypothetical protein